MSRYLEAPQQALEVLENLPGDDLRHAVGAVNPFLENSPSPCRVQQPLAFVADVFLHGGDGDNGHVAHDMTTDALPDLCSITNGSAARAITAWLTSTRQWRTTSTCSCS